MWTMLFNYVGSKALSLSNFNHFKALNLFSFHVAWNAFVKWAYLRTPLSLYRNAKSKCENLMFKVVKKVESVSNWLTFVWIIYRLILTAMSRPARNSVLAYQSTNRPTDTTFGFILDIFEATHINECAYCNIDISVCRQNTSTKS